MIIQLFLTVDTRPCIQSLPLGKLFRFRADYILSQVSHFVKVFFTKIEKIVGFGKKEQRYRHKSLVRRKKCRSYFVRFSLKYYVFR